MPTRPVLLYAPSLRSIGGLHAFRVLVNQVTDWDRIRTAVCSPELAAHLPAEGIDVHVVRDLREGYRELRRRREGHLVLCVQNPALVPRGTDLVTIVQNHAGLHPWSATRLAGSARERLRYPVLAALTAVQLRQSRVWYSLNSRVPWPARGDASWGGALSNRDAAVDVDGYRSAPIPMDGAPPLVVWVGSWWGFRRPLLALDAFARSPLAATGATLVLLASSGDTGVRARVHQRAGQLRQRGLDVRLVEDAPRPVVLDHLRRCTAALFTSAIEGSPMSFIEACRLAPAVIAPDIADFAESIPRDCSSQVRLVPVPTPARLGAALDTPMVER